MLSVIIVGWNCTSTIGACLDSLATHRPRRPLEVIYVDNASTDGSVRLVRQHALGVQVIENARNVGFQRANNQGLEVARGDEILLLNPDTEVLPGSLDTLFDFLRAHPDVGAASARCVRPDGTLQWTIAPFPGLPIIKAWFRATHPALARVFGRTSSAPPAGPNEVPTSQEQDYAYGACFATTRVVVDAVGPMDEGFFLTGGEIAWSCEIRRRGWKVYHVADATIVHRESVARARRSWVSELDWLRAHRRLLYRYNGISAGIVGDFIFSAHLLALLVGRLAGPERSTRSAHARGSSGSL